MLRNDENVLYCNCYYPYVSSPIFLLSCFVNSFSLSMWRMFLKWNVIEMFVFLVSLHYMRTCTKVTFSNNPLLLSLPPSITRLVFAFSTDYDSGLTLSWRRPLSYRNQSIDLRSKSMDWFLYDNVLDHKRVKVKLTWHHFSNF